MQFNTFTENLALRLANTLPSIDFYIRTKAWLLIADHIFWGFILFLIVVCAIAVSIKDVNRSIK